MTTKLLVISDTHSNLYANPSILDEAKKMGPFGALITLGDISDKDYITLFRELDDQIPTQVYGVLGNHDYIGALRTAHIQDLHMYAAQINELTITGIQGAFDERAKGNEMLRLTEEQGNEMIKQLPETNILATHGNWKQKKDSEERHVGLSGITEYLWSHKDCFLYVYGHLHESKTEYWVRKKCGQFQKLPRLFGYRKNVLTTVCIYKWAVIEIDLETKRVQVTHYHG